jgi:uroporphyrinogen decarboxylase
MTSEERVMGALQRKPIDRVPTFEWEISRNLIQAMTPGADTEGFIEQMDIDGIVVHVKYQAEMIDEKTFRDEWGIIRTKTAEEQHIPSGSPVQNEEDLENYLLPDPDAPYRLDNVKTALERFKGKRAVILHLNDVFSLPSRIMSFDEFLMAIYTDPDLVQKLISLTVDYNIEIAKRAWDLGLRIVMTGDDICYSNGPMFSPDQFRELFFPYYMKVMTAYKDIGFLVIKHGDGDVRPIIDMLTAPPIDCYDPMDPSAGMKLSWFKEKYGLRLCLKGNVDCAQTLTFGSVDDTVQETKECLRIGMPGYGYICSSSNSLHSKVKPENYRAMLDTIRTFGVYG